MDELIKRLWVVANDHAWAVTGEPIDDHLSADENGLPPMPDNEEVIKAVIDYLEMTI